MSPEDLLQACDHAREEGMDFPAVWNTLLKRHPLVMGLPTHRVVGGEAQIIVVLLTGHKLVSSASGYSLV
jgi:hypothetical protein